MKRTVLFAPMISLLLLLTACARDTQAEWHDRQEEWQQAEALSFHAEIVSLTEEDAMVFAADVLAEGDTATMTLTAPETLRGLRVIVRQEGTSLQVEDMTVSLTALRRTALPPGEAGAILCAALRRGYILYTGPDRSAAFTGPRDETVTLRLDEAGVPVSAEIARGERTELRLSISNWQTKG